MMLMRSIPLLIFSFFLTNAAYGAGVPIQGRVFVGSTAIKPTELNRELDSMGLKSFDWIPQYGGEVTYSFLNSFEVGLRYSHREGEQDEQNSDLTTEYKATLVQDSALAVLRLALIKTDFFRLDAFGGAGGSNTSLKVKTASQDGQLTRKEGNDWFASPCFAYGGSIAFGYKKIYLAFEAGVETNKIDNFKKVGNVTSDLREIDLSGSYFMLGLIFDGVSVK